MPVRRAATWEDAIRGRGVWLEDNLKALELKLGKDDLARIDRISPPGGVIVPFYPAAFGPGEHRW